MDANAATVEAYGGHGFKWKKLNMSPSCWCDVIQVSGRTHSSDLTQHSSKTW